MLFKYIKRQLISLTAISLAFSCTMPMSGSQKIEKEETLLSIDNEPISKENFVYLYEKNYNNDSAFYQKENVDEYLDLFINFKLKVAEAHALGYDSLKAFQNEYNMYMTQLEEPYLTESVFNDSLVKQAYERQKEEVSAAHILIKVKDNATPEDTLKAYNRTLELLEKVNQGEDFGKLAFQYSEDPSAKQNKGDLGFFTSLQMVYPFEEAAFTTTPGDIAGPIRTRFGYHLLLVKEKRPRFGTLQVQHIMIKSSSREPKQQQEESKLKAKAIYDSLQNGGDWDILCLNFSDDKRSSNNKGILPPVSEVRFPPSFMKGVNELDKIGDISAPVQTDFGWHIIRLYKKEPVLPYEQMYPSLVRKVKKDSRSSTSRAQFINKLKTDNSFIENDENKEHAFSLIDTTLLEGKWTIPTELSTKDQKKVLFTLTSKKVIANDFYNYIIDNQKKTKNDSLLEVTNNYYEKFVDETLIATEKELLPSKYPEYKHLAKEYEDGLLLFRVMEDCVWNKASTDKEGLKAYFNNNINKYQWEDRVSMSVYNTGSKELQDETLFMLDSGRYMVYPTEIQSLYFKDGSSYLYKSTLKDLQTISDALVSDNNLIASIEIQMPPKSGTKLRNNRKEKMTKNLLDSKVDPSQFNIKFTEGKKQHVKVSFYSKDLSNYVHTKNQLSNLSVNFEEGVYTKATLPFANHIQMKEGRYIFEDQERYIICIVNEFLPKGPKLFEEAKGSVIADYQEHLEKTWLESLHQKHQVSVDSTILQSLYRSQESL
ncbi:peptidylprolyl isomerase [Flammeovirga agarivorans]|uniref:PpiC domain-containing protein n=1 Tax=Flammeovirga agarivorans TaxID=2726742 RepID=A0A7X8SI12_9BACT|nr:peptidylprolyl isomerase [Flammeovirga agarivorans]NLR90639.1 hypothetical protein [Flammeovirga agarivorans]